MTNSFDPEKIFAALEDAAEDREKKEYHALLLDKQEKTLLAQLALKEKEASPDGKMSMAEADMRARASEAYRTHIEGYAVAQSEWNRARARYDNLRALGEYRRSQESSRRALTA